MAQKLEGKWKNQRDSVLTLQVKDGIVSGTFDSGVGDDGQPLVVQVQGRALGDIITFNVVYEKYQTIATWGGQLTSDGAGDVLETSWLHVTNVTDGEEPEWLWSTVRTGGDHFRRVE